MRDVVCGVCGERIVGEPGLAHASQEQECPQCGATVQARAGWLMQGTVPELRIGQVRMGSGDDVVNVESLVYMRSAKTILENPTYELHVELAPPELPSTIVIKDSWGDVVELSAISDAEDAASAIAAAFELIYPEMWRSIEE